LWFNNIIKRLLSKKEAAFFITHELNFLLGSIMIFVVY